MSALREPGVIADRWPWGPPVALVVVPRQIVPDGITYDPAFFIIRSNDDIMVDGRERPYPEVEGRWPNATRLTRAEAPRILEGWAGLHGELLARVLAAIDRALADGAEPGPVAV